MNKSACKTILRKKYTLFVSILLIVFAGVLFYFSQLNIKEFRNYHESLAKASTAGVAKQIASVISEQNRLVTLFSEEQVELIEAVKSEPDNDSIREKLRVKIKRFFSNYFAFSVVNLEGKPFFDDFDGLISTVCENDIVSYAKTRKYHPYIHPNSEAYHFDVMSYFGKKNKDGILFISFKADILGDILQSTQVNGHWLMLGYPEKSNLIEVVAEGARNKITRNDYRLSKSEHARILNRVAVKGTRWEAIDLYKPGLFWEHESVIIFEALATYIFIFILCVFFVSRLFREECRSKLMEQQKQDLMGVITHEFRTPVTAIIGALGLLQHKSIATNFKDNVKELVDIALTNTKRLNYLVNDFLDLQKMESGPLSMDMQPLNIVNVIKETIASMTTYAKQFSVSYSFDSNTENIWVQADRKRIEQVVTNLLSNAAKYGGKIKPEDKNSRVEVQVVLLKAYVKVLVTDHGSGIPAEFQQRVFEKFTVFNKQLNGKVKSTGLGLSIAKEIIEAHKGSIGFTSKVDDGTTFYFVLPLAAD